MNCYVELGDFSNSLISKVNFRQKGEGIGVAYSQGIAWDKTSALETLALIGEEDVGMGLI